MANSMARASIECKMDRKERERGAKAKEQGGVSQISDLNDENYNSYKGNLISIYNPIT